jgi:hypothetical protein
MTRPLHMNYSLHDVKERVKKNPKKIISVRSNDGLNFDLSNKKRLCSRKRQNRNYLSVVDNAI